MSMTESIVYGYGFPVGNIEEKTIIDFAKKHIETIRKIEEYEASFEGLAALLEQEAVDEDTIEEFCEELQCIVTGHEGLATIISNVISEETGVYFEYYGDGEYAKASVLLSQRFPWDLNEREKTLTKDEADAIIEKYMAELGISESEVTKDVHLPNGCTIMKDYSVKLEYLE